MFWSMVGRIGLIVLVLVGLLAVTGPRLSAAAEVEVTRLTDSGDYSFFATGFKDNETLSTWLTGPAGQVMATDNETATDRGKARFDLRLPRHFQPGRWAITVHGLKSNSEAIGWFDLPERGPDATLTPRPPSGPAGSTFTFTSTDFRTGETVSYWLTGPDGAAYQGGAVTVASDGTVTFSYAIGSGTQPGAWQMSAYGSESDRYAVVTFMIQ